MSVVVTGSEDERSFVWDITTNQQLAEVEGHKDTVTAVGFHPNFPLLATADMLGFVQVFSTETKELIWSHESGQDLEVMFWHPMAEVVFAGLTNGDLCMLKVRTDELKCYSGGGNGVSSAVLTDNGLGDFSIHSK